MASEILFLNSLDKVAFFPARLLCEMIIFAADQILSAGVSARPLFFVPIIVSGLFLNWWATAIFVLDSSIIHVKTYQLTDFSAEPSFRYLLNITGNHVSYSIVATVVIVGSRFRQQASSLKTTILDDKLRRLSEH